MNTLPRAVTAQIFPSTDSYTALRTHWRALLRSDCKHELTAAHHLLYLALLGKDWRKAFTPITNERKLANGAFPGWALFRALRSLHSPWEEATLLAPFEGIVSLPMLQFVRKLLPLANAYAYRPGDFTSAAWPFAAYNVPESLLAPAPEEGRPDA
jgi:hypothetical protein